MRTLLALALTTATVAAACSEARVVGQACAGDDDCAGLTEGYCPRAGICTRTCSAHSDCGCPGGTTNAELAAGACGAACLDFGDGLLACLRVCEEDEACEGDSACWGSVLGRLR